MRKTRIDAKQAIDDIRAGMSDATLMENYNISSRGLQSLFKKLVSSGLLKQSEIDARSMLQEESVIISLSGFRFAEADAIEVPEWDSRPKPILVASDDKELAALIKGKIESPELPVVIRDGQLPDSQSMEEISPRLVVADVDFSKVNINEVVGLAGKIRAPGQLLLIVDPAHRKVAQSGFVDGVYDFVERPVDPGIFFERIRRALELERLLRIERDQERLMEEKIEEKTMQIVRSKDFLKGVLDSSSEISVVFTDLDGTILFWNKGAENIYGYAAEEMMGTKISKLYPSDSLSRNKLDKMQEMLVTKAETVHTKAKQLTKDGRVVSISLAVSPMLDSDGTIKGILAVGLDVSEELRQSMEIVTLWYQIKNSQDVAVMVISKLIEERGLESAAHLKRISKYCRVLSDKLGAMDAYRAMATARFTQDLVRASSLHDIGTVAVPDAILWSDRPLHPKERDLLQRHTIVGGQALEEAAKKLRDRDLFVLGKDVAYYHHEHWDGSGYPCGLKGTEIPLAARIVAIAHAYDSMTSGDSGKKALSHEQACSALDTGAETLFDPELIKVFKEIQSEFKEIRNTIPDE